MNSEDINQKSKNFEIADDENLKDEYGKMSDYVSNDDSNENNTSEHHREHGEYHHHHHHHHHHRHHHKHRFRKAFSQNIKKFFGFIAIFALLSIVGIAFVTDDVFKQKNSKVDFTSRTVIDGEFYYPRELETFLISGVDKNSDIKVSETSYGNNMQADFIALVIFDKYDKKYSIININRDSMVQVDELDINGNKTGNMTREQIALAHTYGNGSNSSSMNIVRAVSRMFYNININYYATITMDTLPIINDAVGYVTVKMPEDYTNLDPAFIKGEDVQLKGKQSTAFVRARMSVDDGTNISRMNRQKLYIDSFIKQYQTVEFTEEFIMKLYSDVSKKGSLVTNTTPRGIQNLMQTISAYTYDTQYSLNGESVKGEKFMEYNLDQSHISELSKQLLFKKAED